MTTDTLLPQPPLTTAATPTSTTTLAAASGGGQPLSYVGAGSDHGGKVMTGSSDFTLSGKGLARMGDMHSCPLTYPNGVPHGVTPIVSTPVKALLNDGKLAASVGATTGCGATLIEGDPNWVAA